MQRRFPNSVFNALANASIGLPRMAVLFDPNTAGKSNMVEAPQAVFRIGTLGSLGDGLAEPIRGLPMEGFFIGLLGGDIARFLNRLPSEHPRRFRDGLRHLRVLVPSVEDLTAGLHQRRGNLHTFDRPGWGALLFPRRCRSEAPFSRAVCHCGDCLGWLAARIPGRGAAGDRKSQASVVCKKSHCRLPQPARGMSVSRGSGLVFPGGRLPTSGGPEELRPRPLPASACQRVAGRGPSANFGGIAFACELGEAVGWHRTCKSDQWLRTFPDAWLRWLRRQGSWRD